MKKVAIVLAVLGISASAVAKNIYIPPEKVDGFTVSTDKLLHDSILPSARDVIFYVKVIRDCHTYAAPFLSARLRKGDAKKGEIFPVFGIVGTQDGIFYKIGEGVYILKDDVDVIYWK